MKIRSARVGLQSKGFLIALLLILQGVFLIGQLFLVDVPSYGDEHTTDLILYRQYALDFLDGKIPYRDFQMEYPPLALVAFGLPALFSLHAPINYEAYRTLFGIEMAILSLTANFILLRTLSIGKLKDKIPIRVMAMYTLGVCVLSPLLPWRFDMFPALLTILAFLFLQSGKPLWSGIMLGLGIIAKLYPLVILPIFFAYSLAGKDFKAFWRMMLGLALPAAILLPLFLLDPGWPVEMLSYHQLRGLNIDSLPGGIFLLFKALGSTNIQVAHDFGSFNIQAPFSNQVKQWLTPLSVIALGSIVTMSFLRFRQERNKNGSSLSQSLVAYTVLALLAFILTSKVFSPQYLIWLLPFIPILKIRHTELFLIIAALTVILYPFVYALLIEAEPVSALLLNLRNLLAVILFAWLLVTHIPSKAIPQ